MSRNRGRRKTEMEWSSCKLVFVYFSLFLLICQASVCQEMLTEFRNAVSCKKNSRSRRRRPLSSMGGGVLRHPSRLALAGPRPLRLVRGMRLSNGKLYSGTGPLTGGLAELGGGMGGGPDLGPGPQRLLEDAMGCDASGTLPPASALVAPPPAPPRSFLQNCSNVRICQECRRIQSLRPTTLTPPPPPPPSSSSSASSGSRIPPSMAMPGHHPRHNPHHHLHYHLGSMSLPRLPPLPPAMPADRADSDGGAGSPLRGKNKPAPPPRPMPPPKTPADLLGGHNWAKLWLKDLNLWRWNCTSGPKKSLNSEVFWRSKGHLLKWIKLATLTQGGVHSIALTWLTRVLKITSEG